MKTRINFNTWGRGLDKISIPSFAYREYDRLNAIEFVVKAFERKNNLVCCAGPKDEGKTFDRRGNVESHHYQFTLGQKVSGGGYSPVAEIWVAI